MGKQKLYHGYASLTAALRDYSEGPSWLWGKVCDDAANEIDALAGDLAETRIALANAECRERMAKARLAELESRQSTHYCLNCAATGPRLAEAEALLREARKDALQLMDTMQREDFGTYSIVPGIADGIARIDAFLAADRENEA